MFQSINSKQCVLINSIYKSCFRPLNPFQRRRYSSSVRCKVAIVTGAARGIGFHIAQSLLDAGAHSVMIADILEDECREAAAKLNKRYGGPRAFPQKCDVSNSDEMEKLFQNGNLKYTDIIVNNAGVEDNQNYENMLRTNINGLINGTMLGFKYLKKGGTIINVASIDGLQPSYYSPIYSGVNSFSIGYTRSFGHDYFYQLKKIKLLALCPGYTKTPLSDNKKLGFPGLPDPEKAICSQPLQDPEEVGNCVITMLEDGENGSVWIVENNQCYKYVPPDRMSLCRVPANPKMKHNSMKEDTNAERKQLHCMKKGPCEKKDDLHRKSDHCLGSDHGTRVEWTKQPICADAKKVSKKDPCKNKRNSENSNPCKRPKPNKESSNCEKSDPCLKPKPCKELVDLKVKWTKQPTCSETKKTGSDEKENVSERKNNCNK